MDFDLPLRMLLNFLECLIRGWTAHILWAWFAVRYLHAPFIPSSVAAGLFVLMRVLMPPNRLDDPEPIPVFVKDTLVCGVYLSFGAFFYWMAA